MYAIHPIPLSEVKALRKHAPKFGWQYVVVVLGNGLTLPPLYFTHGGVKALFSALKQVRSHGSLQALLQAVKLLCGPGPACLLAAVHATISIKSTRSMRCWLLHGPALEWPWYTDAVAAQVSGCGSCADSLGGLI